MQYKIFLTKGLYSNCSLIMVLTSIPSGRRAAGVKEGGGGYEKSPVNVFAEHDYAKFRWRFGNNNKYFILNLFVSTTIRKSFPCYICTTFYQLVYFHRNREMLKHLNGRFTPFPLVGSQTYQLSSPINLLNVLPSSKWVQTSRKFN